MTNIVTIGIGLLVKDFGQQKDFLENLSKSINQKGHYLLENQKHLMIHGLGLKREKDENRKSI